MAIIPKTRIYEGGELLTGATLNANATNVNNFLLAPPAFKAIKSFSTGAVTIPNNVPYRVRWEAATLNREFAWTTTPIVYGTSYNWSATYVSATTATFTAGIVSLGLFEIGDVVTTSGFSNAAYNVTNAIVISRTSNSATLYRQSGSFTNPYSGTGGTVSVSMEPYLKILTGGWYLINVGIQWQGNANGTRETFVFVTDGDKRFSGGSGSQVGYFVTSWSPVNTGVINSPSVFAYLREGYYLSVSATQTSGGNLNTPADANGSSQLTAQWISDGYKFP